MIESSVGIIIATSASIALLISIGISVKSIDKAGKEPLNKSEIIMLKNAGFNNFEIDTLEKDLQELDYE